MSIVHSSIDIEIVEPQKHSNNSAQTMKQQSQCLDYIGLYNHGNTCYLNSLIQFLFMTEEFRSKLFLWKYDQILHGNKADCIPYQLQKLFARLQLRIRSVEETSDLTKSFQWDYNQLAEQNDIQELCRVLFDAITLTDVNDPFINDLFEGELNSIIKCSRCNNQSDHYEKFLDLSLPVKNANIDLSTLEKSFKHLLSVEKMDNDNMYYCEKCNTKVEADRFSVINSLPKILFVQLKRFEYDYQTYSKKKITTHFSFPTVLDMKTIIPTEEILNSIVFELYCVIVHSGTANGGHYYSLIKSFEDGKWYCFDDSKVYESSIEVIEQTYGNSPLTAYILGYKRKDIGMNTRCLFEINDDLKKDIEAEEIEYQKQLAEEKERMSYLHLKFLHMDKHNTIRIKKCETVKEMKLKAISAFNLNNTHDERDIRIRVMNANGNKIIDVLNHESKTLDEYNISHNRTYTFEIKSPNESFEDFDPDSININIAIWNDNYNKDDNFEEIKIEFTKISINKFITHEKLFSVIREIFVIKTNDNTDSNEDQIESLLIMKKNDYGVNNFSFLHFEPQSKDFFGEEMRIYIEANTTFEKSEFKKFFENQVSNVFIFFNTPLPKTTKRITIKSYTFDLCVEIKPKKTLRALKEMIGKKLDLTIDSFIMKKNSHNGVELKHLDDIIEKYTTRTLNVYIELGKPVKTSEIKVSLQLYYIDPLVFALFPYKTIDCGKHTIDSNWSIKQLKDFIKSNKDLNKIINIEEHQLDTLLIRQDLQFKPGKIYDESHSLKDIGVIENSILIMQFISEHIKISPNLKDIQLTLRYWDPSNWILSNPIEFFISKKMTLRELGTLIIQSLPQIELYPENIMAFPIVNEIYLYMDEIEKMEFTSLEDFNESLVDNYPLMIGKDGYMLIIKDITKIPREPNEEEREFFCKKSIKEPLKKMKKPLLSTPDKNKHKPIHSKMSKPKEKALVIKVKHNSSLNEAKSTNANTPDDNMTNEKSEHLNEIKLPNHEL